MIFTHVRHAALAALVITASLPIAAEAAPFNYTFDADGQGWFAITPVTVGAAVHLGGGNPGGMITTRSTVAGNGPGAGLVTSTLGVLHQLSLDAASYGGTLSFDSEVYASSSSVLSTTLTDVTMSGFIGGHYVGLRRALGGALGPAFTTTSMTLDASSNWMFFDLNDPAQNRAASQADFLTYLPLLTSIWINQAFTFEAVVSGTVVVGFDNIRFTELPPPTPSTVPEPATLTLLGLGLAGIGARRRRRR